jgi:hypothetical protein
LIWTRLEALSALVLPVGIALTVHGAPAIATPPSSGVVETTRVTQEAPTYSEDVKPILEESCVHCHGGFNEEEGEVVTEELLDLTTYDGMMAGSKWGSVVEPGDAVNSVLYDMIKEGDMPDEGDPLPQEQLDIIGAWIDAGAQNN